MLRFLSYNHLFSYSILFLLTLALRAPSFHTQYFGEDESFYMVAAEKVVDGQAQYLDTWDNKPPILVWVYSLFLGIFGEYALLAIRIFTSIYIYLTALLVNRFVDDNRLLSQFSLLPAFLVIFLSSVPWYTQELNGEILMNLPIVVAVTEILRLRERSRKNASHLFIAGLLLGIAFMIKYQAILIFLGMLTAYIFTQPTKLSETFSYIFGFLLSVFTVILAVYFTGALDAYMDIGVLYNIDYIRVGTNPGEVVNPLFNLGQYAQLWGIFILLGFAGIIHYRLNYFSKTIRLRKVESVTLYWFVVCLLTIIIGGSRLYLHYFYLLVPPLAIYAAKTLELKIRAWLRNIILLAAFAIPMLTFAVFLFAAFPKEFSFADKYLQEGGWTMQFRKELNEPHPLEAYIDRANIHHGILVLAYDPTIYTRLDLPCATKYTNFSIANFKFDFFPDHDLVSLVSRSESRADVYRAFEKEMPDYIIDPLDLFPILSAEMPLLFQDYEAVVVDEGHRSYLMYRK